MHAPPIGFCVLVVHGTYCGLPRPPYQPESCDPCRTDGSQLGRRPSHAPLGAVSLPRSCVSAGCSCRRRGSNCADGSSEYTPFSPACGEIDIASREHVHVRFFRNGRPGMLPAFLHHHLQLQLHLPYPNPATRLVIFSHDASPLIALLQLVYPALPCASAPLTPASL